MMLRLRWVSLIALVVVCSVSTGAQRPNRMDDECNPVLIRRAYQEKAQRWRDGGVPERLIENFIPRIAPCLHCIRTAPDVPTIVFDWTPGKEPRDERGLYLTSIAWSAEAERIARGDVRAGILRSFKIVPFIDTCVCNCGPGGRISEDVATVQDGMTISITVDSSNINNPPPADIGPDVDEHTPEPMTTKPPKKLASAKCPVCAGLAASITSLGDALDALWDRKIALQHDMWTIENQMIDRVNEINKLVAQLQLRDPAFDRQKMNDLEAANEKAFLQLGDETEQRDVVDKEIKRLTDQVDGLLKAFAQCEATMCPTGVATNTPPPPPPPVTDAPPPVVGDFNGDGNQDVAIITASTDASGGKVTISPGLGDGTFGMPQTIPLMRKPTSIASNDIDLDGLDDLVIGEADGATGQVDVFTGGQLQAALNVTFDTSMLDLMPAVTIGTPAAPAAIVFGRLNDDAIPDLALIDLAGNLDVVNLSVSTSGALVAGMPIVIPGLLPPGTIPGPNSIAIGRANVSPNMLNAIDDANDIFVATATGVDIIDNQQLKNRVPDVVHFDISGNVYVDAHASSTSKQEPLLSIPNMEMMLLAAGRHPIGVVVADLDGNNSDDLLLLNRGTGTISTFLANPAGTPGYQAPTRTFVGDNAVTVAPFNFNGDGRPDLAILHQFEMGGGDVTVFNGINRGTFGFEKTFLDGDASIGLRVPFGTSNLAVGRFDASTLTDDVLIGDRVNGTVQFGAPFQGGFAFRPPQFFSAVSLAASLDNAGGTNDVVVLEQDQTVLLRLQTHEFSITVTLVQPSQANPLLRGGLWARPPDVWAALSTPFRTHSMTGRLAGFARAQQQGRGGASPARPAIAARITSLGASTGEAFQVQFVNNRNTPVKVAAGRLAVEAVEAPRNGNTLGGGVVTAKAEGYCLDFSKEVPTAGTTYRVAPRAVQRNMRSMRDIIAATDRLAAANRLRPDSDRRGYVDAIKQWSLWTRRENWDVGKFGDAFVERTKKNLAELKQPWSSALEQQVRALVPNRWRDVQQVLTAAEPRRR